MNLNEIYTLAQEYREPTALPTDPEQLMDLMSDLNRYSPKGLYRESPEAVIFIHKALRPITTEYGQSYPYLAEDLSTNEPNSYFVLVLNKPYIDAIYHYSYVPFHVGKWAIDGKEHDAILMLPCKQLATAG